MSFGGFGTNTQQTGTTGGGLFGSTFGSAQNTTTPATGGTLFGNTNAAQQGTNTGGGLFGATNTNQPATGATGGGLFGSTQPAGGLFGNANTNTAQQQPAGGLFGNTAQQGTAGTTPAGGLFGSTAQTGEFIVLRHPHMSNEENIKNSCTVGKVHNDTCTVLSCSSSLGTRPGSCVPTCAKYMRPRGYN